MGNISEWLKVMLEEIDRKEEEARDDRAAARDDKEKGVPVRPGEEKLGPDKGSPDDQSSK